MNEIGDLRPSQLIFTFGVGSLLDLPNMSVLVMGLDDWDTRYCVEITEDRLLATLQRRLGTHVKKLYLPPMSFDDMKPDPGAPGIGVPVAPFPRWLRCPICNTLSTIDSGIFELAQDRWRSDRTRYVHASCTKGNNPTALPVRFLLACREGHMMDFPWVEYVHEGKVLCKPSRLTLREFGAAGDASDIILKCIECNTERRMGDAFDRDKFRFQCQGHHPHLRLSQSEACQEEACPILLGASNSWFPLFMSALSIPPRVADQLQLRVHEHWSVLKDIPSLEVAKYVVAPSRMPEFASFTAEQIWETIEAKRNISHDDSTQEADLKIAEWDALSQPEEAQSTRDFQLSKIAPPQGFEDFFEYTVLLERVREVRALLGFTRIESKGDFADAAYTEDGRVTSLTRGSPTWLPASEVRGEGIFLKFNEGRLLLWEKEQDVRSLEREYFLVHRLWRQMRRLQPYEGNFPGMRFVLIHSLTHALLRQISLECGYTVASLRERIYCHVPDGQGNEMAGCLIYTAATDSEGTLGGLVGLGEPISLGRHLQQALEAMRICTSDPLCAEHPPTGDGRSIHGACCHACLFAPETSCERGNRYLDRNVLVGTFSTKAVEFFDLE